jgi:hypothetical protein
MLSAAAPLLPDEINTFVCVRAEHLLCVFFRPHPPKLRATYIYALVKDSQRDKKVLLLFQNVLYFSLFPYRVSLILIKFSKAMFFFFVLNVEIIIIERKFSWGTQRAS